MKRTLTTGQLSRLLEKHPQTIYRWIKEGMPHGFHDGGLQATYRFNLDEVSTWLKENRR